LNFFKLHDDLDNMKTVRCPTCGKESYYDVSNKYRPFCCERCATLDLGAWAEEKFAIPVEDLDPASVNKNQNDDDSLDENFVERPSKDKRN
jgi:endogenous inhibitor of DNA gyrase (YacG/DUF329 family)